MHTDEYEISINRELNHCISVVKKTRSNLEQLQQKYGMEFEQAVIAAGENRLRISAKDLAKWQDDSAALPRWEQRLQEYRVALSTMRISAS
nr:hypothetical protein [uncultured Desulfobulbus sp.]